MMAVGVMFSQMKRRSDAAESTGFENRGIGFIQVSSYFVGV